MKLLMLLPNLILIAISGLNISNELETAGVKNLAVMVLHISVLIICLIFVTLIIRSMFTIVEVEETFKATPEHNELSPTIS